MRDQEKYDYVGMARAKLALAKVKKKITIYVCLLDQYGPNAGGGGIYADHGEKSEAMVKTATDIVLSPLPNVGIIIHKCSKISQVKEHLVNGECHILNVSQVWRGSVSAINDLAKRGVFIIASGGNEGLEGVYMYPAAGDDCLAVNALGIKGDEPYGMGYNNEHDKIDIAMFTDMVLEIYSGIVTYGGTSCASPFMTAIACIIYVWYMETFNLRTPTYNEMNTYLFNMCVDIHDKGKDYLTGHGVFRFPEEMEFHWGSWAKEFMKRLGYRKDKLGNLDDYATREQVFWQFAYVMGWRPSGFYSPSEAVAFLNTLGCRIEGRPTDDGETDMAFKEPVTRNEVHRIQAECIEAQAQLEYAANKRASYEAIRKQNKGEPWTDYGIYLMNYCERNGKMVIYNKEIGDQKITCASVTQLAVRQAGWKDYDDNNYYD